MKEYGVKGETGYLKKSTIRNILMLMCGSVKIALIPYVKHRAKYVYFQQEYNAYKFLYSHNIILKFHLQEE